MPAYVQTGKFGDLISVLPLLLDDYQKTGEKSALVVSSQFKDLVARIDYIVPCIYGGDMQDLSDAVMLAKRSFRDVRITQMHGRGFEFEHRHPSFQYDQWDRAGRLAQWDYLPTVLPRTKSNVVIPTKPFIVYADLSQSSPFPHKEELASALKENFSQRQIVRLSELRASHPLDLLALFDAADSIVTVDTMFLHMAKACAKPIVALVSDRPSRWQGSAWSKQFTIHCRYADFPRRRNELIRKLAQAMDGRAPIATMRGPTSNNFGYNLGMIWHGEYLLTTHRYHPDRTWKTRISIHDGLISSDVLFPKELDGYSVEDARLFHHNGKLMMNYVVATAIGGHFRSVVGYGMLVQREGRWTIDRHYQVKFGNNDYSGMVKNWCPFEYNGKIHFIWGSHKDEQIIIEVDGDKVTNEYRSPEAKWDFGEVRGGALINHNGKLLRFFHSRTGENLNGSHGSFQYHIGAMTMEQAPPFKIVRVSQHPILSGDERYVPGCHHWKPNVVIPYGVVNRGRQGNPVIQISIGRNDCMCEVLELQESDFNFD